MSPRSLEHWDPPLVLLLHPHRPPVLLPPRQPVVLPLSEHSIDRLNPP